MTVSRFVSPEASAYTGRSPGIHTHWITRTGLLQTGVFTPDELEIVKEAQCS